MQFYLKSPRIKQRQPGLFMTTLFLLMTATRTLGNVPAVSGEDSIRVSIGLLNDLMNLTSELVLGRNQLLQGLEGHRKHVEGIDPILQNIDSITTQLQERVMQTRMQPWAMYSINFRG